MITSILKLDIGGQLFATTLGTLTRDPSSKLAKLAYDKWLSTPSPSSSTSTTNNISTSAPTIFIDRDPSHFRYILNFLRDGESAVFPIQNETVLRELLREVEFYEMKNLEQKIRSILANRSCSEACFECRSANRTRSIEIDQSARSDWSPKKGDLVKWADEGFESFWRNLMDKITHRGYVDWLFCHHCDNDYEVRLPELPDVLYGWQNVKNFLSDMNGKLDAYVNEKCVYVAWKNVYCGKDGYLDSVRFVMHVPLVWLKPFSINS